MTEILMFLAQHCSFLYERYEFRFVDSMVSSSFGGDAYVVLQSSDVRIRFVKDRGQFFLDLQSVGDPRKDKWYSFDLIRQLLIGGNEQRPFMEAANAEFLKSNIDEILDAFSSTSMPSTANRLRQLEKARAKRLFG